MNKLTVLLPLAAFSAFASAADTVVFDGLSGGPTFTGTGSTPHTLMGTAVNLGNVGTGPIKITGLDLAYRAYTSQSYTNIRLDIMFFGTATGATTGSAAAFSNLLFTRVVNTGVTTTVASTRYTYGTTATPGATPAIALTNGFILNNPSQALGIQILIRGDKGDGAGLVLTDDLGISLRHTVAPTVGSSAVGGAAGGFYRNASNATPTTSTVLLGSDYRSLTAINNTSLSMRIYAQPVPEPASMVALGLGAAAMLRRRKRA